MVYVGGGVSFCVVGKFGECVYVWFLVMVVVLGDLVCVGVCCFICSWFISFSMLFGRYSVISMKIVLSMNS